MDTEKPSREAMSPVFIDLTRDPQWKRWTRELGCSESRLLDAVSMVGPAVDDVKRFLRIHDAKPRA